MREKTYSNQGLKMLLIHHPILLPASPKRALKSIFLVPNRPQPWQYSFIRSKCSRLVAYFGRNNSTVLGPDLREFTLKLNSSVFNWPCDGCIQAVSGYYIFTEMKLPIIATKPFLSPTNTSTIISIVIKHAAIAQEALDFADVSKDSTISHLVVH